tara:strand:- start:442 stop:1014 length:573 start_codon:yes stop_codon:yes gene_type:complete
MPVSTIDARGFEGNDDFIKEITSGNHLGMLVPADTDRPTQHSNMRILFDDENPRLVFSPVCEHRESGMWLVAVFHAVDTDEDINTKPNIRGSLALSMVAGLPLVQFGDMAFVLTESWSTNSDERETVDPSTCAIEKPVDMPIEIYDDFKTQFVSPSKFVEGPICMNAINTGIDVEEVVERLLDSIFEGKG